MQYFQILYLKEADLFVRSLHPKAILKLEEIIDHAQESNDPRLLKKLRDEIWEFRMRFGSLQIRLLAFWDKTDSQKTDKTPGNEIERAKNIRKRYFENKE